MNGYALKTDITGIDTDKENLITYTNGELDTIKAMEEVFGKSEYLFKGYHMKMMHFQYLKPKKNYLLDIRNFVYRNNHYLAFHRNLSFS